MVAAIRAIAADLPDETGLAHAARIPGLAKSVTEALTELHQHELDSNDLATAAESAPDRLTAQVLTQLAHIDTALRDMGSRYGLEFGADRAVFCIGSDQSFTFPIKHLLVIGSPHPQPLYEKWLAWLATNNVKVDVVLEQPPAASSLFQSTAETQERLGAKHSSVVEGQQWLSALFSDRTSDQGPQVTVTHCLDPLSECEWVVRECQRLVREGEYEGDMAIFARRPENYVPLLVSTARRLGLRVKGLQSVPLLSNGFARTTLSLLRTLAGTDVRHLARLARTSYFPATPQKQAWIDEACLKAHLSTDPWQTLADTPTDKEATPAWLPPLVEWRQAHATLPKTLPLWLEALRAIWNDTTILDTLVDSAVSPVERDGRAIVVMQRALRDVHVPGNTQEHSLTGLVALTEEAWATENVLWSDHTPGIEIVSSTNQLVGKRHVLALGLVEGVMPVRRQEHPVLQDWIREHLATACPHRLTLPTSHVTARQERDEFVRLCGSATASLSLCCAVGQDENRTVPAFYLTEIKRARPDTRQVKVPNLVFAPPKGQPASDTDLRVRNALDAPRVQRTRTVLVTEAAKQAVRVDSQTGVTLEQVAEAAHCPFRSTAKHSLKIKRPWKDSVLAVLRDVPDKAAVWTMESEDEVRSVLDQMAEERILRVGAKLTEHELKMLSDAKDRVLESWVDAWKILRQAVRQADKVLTDATYLQIDGRKCLTEGVDVTDRLPTVFLGEDWQAIVLHRPLFLGSDASPQHSTYLGLVEKILQRTGRKTFLVSVIEDHTLNVVKFQEGGPPNFPRSKVFKPESKENQIADIKRGVVAVTEGAMQTTPGPHCNECDLADLCRDHANHGETAQRYMEPPI